jgi:hypothetical protein
MADSDITVPAEWAIQIADPEGALVVRMGYEGNVEFGPGIDPEDAAVRFYDKVASMIWRGARTHRELQEAAKDVCARWPPGVGQRDALARLRRAVGDLDG